MMNLDSGSLGMILAVVGLVFMGMVGVLLFTAPRMRLPATPLPSSPVQADPDHPSDAVLLVESGGRISWINARGRQMFSLIEREIPNLERLSRRAQPAETFLGLCSAEGQAQVTVDGRMVEACSYALQLGGQPSMLLSFRYPDAAAGEFLQAAGVSRQALHTIAELAQAITASLDLNTTIAAVLQSIDKLIRADILEINVWDAAEKCLVPYRLIGEPGEERIIHETTQRYYAGEGLSGILLQTRAPLLVADLRERPDIVQPASLPLPGLRCYLGVPLMYETNLVGTLQLGSLQEGAYTQVDMDLLTLLAPQAAAAVRNALLYQGEQRRSAELAGLAQLSQALGLYHDSRDLYSHLVQSIAPLFKVNILGFLIYNESKHMLEGQVPFRGLPAEFVPYYSQLIEPGSPAEQFLLSQKMLISENAAADPYWISIGFDHLAQPASLHETVFMPLKSSGRLLGYVQVSNHTGGFEAFSQEELHLLEITANQAAPIIENTILIRQSRQRAQRAEVLRQIASLASSAATLDEILKFSVQELTRLLKADISLIFLLDETNTELRLHQASAVGIPEGAVGSTLHLAVDDPQFYFTITGRMHVLVSGKMADETTLPPFYRTVITLLNMQSAIVIPLIVRDRGVGEFWLGSHNEEFFDRGDLLTVSTACGQLAGVVEQSSLAAQTDESLRRRLEQLTALTRISRELSATLDVKYLLQIVFDETLRTSRADSGTILLFEQEDTAGLAPRVQYYVGDAPAGKLVSIEKMALELAEPVLVADYASSDDQPASPGVQSALVVPILYQHRVAGMIHLRALTAGRFDQAAVEITQALAVQVSLVLGNVLQYQNVLSRGELLKRQVDTLAGLTETSQVLRAGQPLEQSLQAIASAIQQATPFQAVLISVYQPQDDQLQRVCGTGFTDETWLELKSHHQPWQGVQGLLRPEFRINRSYFIPADQQANIPPEIHTVTILPSLAQKPADAWDADDMLLVPLLDDSGAPLGLVSVDNPRDGHRPDRTTIEALELFAGQAALAVNVHRRLNDLNSKVENLQASLSRADQVGQAAQDDLPALLQKDLEQSLTIRQLTQQSLRIRNGLEIALQVNQQADLPAVMRVLGKELVSRMSFDLALAAEDAPGGPRLLDVIGSPPAGANPEALFGQRNPLRGAFRDGQMLLLNNLDQDTELQSAPLLHSLGARSLACLPMQVDGKVIAAVMAVGRKVLPPFSDEDRQVFAQLTRQVSITLKNLQLQAEANRRLQEVGQLLAFSRKLGSLNPASILSTLVDSIRKTIPTAQAAMAALWDDRARQLTPQSASGYTDNRSLMEIVYTSGAEAAPKSLPLQVFLGGHPLRIAEANFARDYNLSAEDLLRYRRAAGGHLPVSSLMVPIRTGEVNLGLLVVDNFSVTSAFANEDEALADSLAQQAALALENARLFIASEKRAMQLQSLTNVAGTMTSSLQTDQLVTSLLDQLRQVIPYDTATLWLRRGNQLTIAAASGFLDSEQRLGLAVAVEDSLLLNEMIHTSQPISVMDVRSDQRFPSLVELDYRSWLGVPLIAKGEVIGVVALEKTEVGFYTSEHIQSAVTFAGQSAIALENARLFEESQHRAAELDQRSQRLALLNRLSSELAASLDVDTILRSAAQEIQGALNASVVSALQVAEDGRVTLRIEAPIYEPELPQEMASVPAFEHLRETLGIFSSGDVSQEPDLVPLRAFFARRGTRSLLAVPMLSAGRLIGIFLLQVSAPYRFTSPEIELALTIANQTAIAVQNARLYSETVSLTEDLEQRVNQRTAELVSEHRNTEALLAVITELSASLDIYQVLTRTLDVLGKAVEADQCIIFLARGGPLDVFFRTGCERPATGGLWPVNALEAETASLVLNHRHSVLVEDVEHDVRFRLQPGTVQSFRSVLAVPLVLGEDVFGALLMLSAVPSNFHSDQVNLVEAAARQISVSLNNTELFNLIRDQAEKLGSLLREQQVEASRSRAILEAVADGVLVTDAGNAITLFNASAERILDLHSDQMTGKTLEQFPGLFGKSTRQWMEAIRSWMNDPLLYEPGGVFSEQVQLDNSRVVEVDLAPVFLRSRFLGTVSIFHDITNEVRIDRLKSEFVANVSHELRTPMTSIKGYVDVLLMGAAGALTDQQKGFLQVVQNNTQRLHVLVSDLLDISRIEAGRVTLNQSTFNLAEVAQEVMDDLQQRCQEENKPMQISLEIPSSLPWVHGDVERVQQVLAYLVSNAWNYTPKGGKVALNAHLLENEVQVDVVDNGIGIKPEDQPRIFERFYRGEDPLVLATAGTGLGLAIVKNLVEMHRGRIWFTSEGVPGKGSIFSFTLPLQQAGV